ncbi:MAG TPA: TonB family protein [Terriglobales bacterium]|nr:TonB family protein [Terriglobales bacterium]
MATIDNQAARTVEVDPYYVDRHAVPVLLAELADERARSRVREASLLSLVIHLLLFIAILLAPKYVPKRALKAWTAQELIQQRELTYLELPPDKQVAPKRPTDVISDKDRMATRRRATLDRKELTKILDSARPGPAGPPAVPAPPVSQAQVTQATPPAAQQPPVTRPENRPGNQLARLEPPALTGRSAGPFGGGLSAGSAIEQAARAAAANRAGGGGAGGDYGLGRGRVGDNAVQSNLDILSDTMGVDFGPYLARVLHDVRENWYNLIPEVARAPLMKRGKVSIEFAILRDGGVAGMRVTGPSGDVSLDRAAWGGITASNPFPPLPGEFGGQYLALRFHFYYNPDRAELR